MHTTGAHGKTHHRGAQGAAQSQAPGALRGASGTTPSDASTSEQGLGRCCVMAVATGVTWEAIRVRRDGYLLTGRVGTCCFGIHPYY